MIGCGGSENDAATVLACVRSRNTSEILAAAAHVPPLPTLALAQATFHPTIDNITVFANYQELSASGAFAKVPYLAGHADHEDGWYRISGWGAKLNLTNAQWGLFTQRAFSCPTAYATNNRVQHGVPTWRYRYYGDWDNLRLYNGTAGLGPKGSGAYHGCDLNMVFGTAEDVSGITNSPAEDATIKYIQGAWAAFARDSNIGLAQYGWPEYTGTNHSKILHYLSSNRHYHHHHSDDGIITEHVLVNTCPVDNTKTLVQLALNEDSKPSFIDAMVYDKLCPAKNDPLPGRGLFSKPQKSLMVLFM